MYYVLCASAHHDVTYFEFDGMLRNKKIRYLKNEHEVTLNKKKS